MSNNKEQFPRGIEVVGSAIIEDNEGKILLVKSPKWHDKWILPGGHIKAGERIKEALLREAEEEVGLKLTSTGIVGFGEIIGSKDYHRPAHFIYFDLLCKTNNKNVTLDNVELTEYIWAKPEQISTVNLSDIHKKIVKNYLRLKS